ncbi:hypothetical protein WJX72_011949 [[Myrmecia] bisecta]|uniref:Major facilitator superfamily (MFS) profile domain-containing protein n=1 Tax=[Myrmecia] bisecta TaxID=41462 RepID=A0AAW1Q4S4_9CHLO
MCGSQLFLADISGPHNRAQSLGTNQAASLIGSLLGPTIGGFLADAAGLRAPFAHSAHQHAQQRSVAATTSKHQAHASPNNTIAANSPRPPKRKWLQLLQSRDFGAIALINGVMFMTQNGARAVLMPLLATQSFGLSPSILGLVFSGMAVVSLLLVMPAALVADRLGRKWTIVPSAIGLATALACMAVSGRSELFIAAACIYAMSNACIGATPAAYAADIMPAGLGGFGLGIYRCAGDIGLMLGPAFLGWLADLTSWRTEVTRRVSEVRSVNVAVTGKRLSLPAWLLRIAPQLVWLKLAGEFPDVGVSKLQELLDAAITLRWLDLAQLKVQHAGSRRPIYNKLYLLPPAKVQAAALPVFGRTDLGRNTCALAGHTSMELLSLRRPLDEAGLAKRPLDAELFDDIATYFPQTDGSWNKLRALSASVHNEIVFDVDSKALFPSLEVLALRGQFSMLDMFELADTGTRSSAPAFAPLLQRAVFCLGHGLSELVAHRTLCFPNLTRHIHLRVLIIEEGMLRLPIPASRLPSGLQELVLCTRAEAAHVDEVLQGQAPPSLGVHVVRIGSSEYKAYLRPYFGSLKDLGDLVGFRQPCP